MDMCSQQSGTFSMQPFCIVVFINLLLVITCCSIRLDTRLKINFPSTFIRAMGRKSLMFDGDGGLVFGIKNSIAYRHCSGTIPCLRQEEKMLKRKLLSWVHFLYTLYGIPLILGVDLFLRESKIF